MWDSELVLTERGVFEVFRKGHGPAMAVTHMYSEFDVRGNQFAACFTDRHTVYLVNLTDCGNSRRVQDEFQFSMAEAVADLEAIRSALNIDKWAFGGNSTGGIMGLLYSLLYPQSLTKLIVGGASASGAHLLHKDCIYSPSNKHFERVKVLLELLMSPSTSKSEIKELNKEWALLSLLDEKSYDIMATRPNSGRVHAKRLAYISFIELPSFDIRPRLSSIDVPVYIFVGRYDVQAPYQFGEELALLIPNARFEVFEASNHYPFIEEEQKFHKFVEEFALG